MRAYSFARSGAPAKRVVRPVAFAHRPKALCFYAPPIGVATLSMSAEHGGDAEIGSARSRCPTLSRSWCVLRRILRTEGPPPIVYDPTDGDELAAREAKERARAQSDDDDPAGGIGR
jgi:hypothetical protein